uniref:Fatty-acid amide hydrolase 1 n=1 Tax=Xenopus tropicalis TaxID=8364 RepID=A0A6I8PYC5_XENTR
MLALNTNDIVGLCALLGCSAATVVLLLRWLDRKRIGKQVRLARARRDAALGRMEEAVRRLSAEHPVADPEGILSLSLPELASKLKDGSLSPEMVLHSYMRKALDVTSELNCVTDYLPECETQLVHLRGQKTKGLLYGVPISLKDNFNYTGHDSTLGLLNQLNRPACEDSVIAKVLKVQGALPFMKTNIPQSMLNYDCSNPIYGRTLNPLNHKKTPGGSSGGEGSLIAAGGSILGIGSDIGGSIRFPSAFCGICGFKPTANRLSKLGVKTSSAGQKSVAAMIGPLARDVDSLVLCMRALLCEEMFQLDPTIPPLPFNEEIYSSTRPLRIGYYETDDATMATPSMKRAVHETKELLERAGHKMVPFTPPSVEKSMFELIVKGLLADGGSTFLDNFKGDQVDPNLKTQVSTYGLPYWLKIFISFIVKPVVSISVKDLWKHHLEVEAYRQEFISQWKKLEIDAVLCPILSPALTIGYPGKLSTAVSYTILYNLVDFPVGVVPVTTVTKDDEEGLKAYKGHKKDYWDKLLKEALTDSIGLPVSVQCVALPWQEEQCLRLMKEVETLTQERRTSNF